MRVLRGTLTFVLGMIIGIILFVLAIGGAVVAIGTSITVGELQGNFTENDIISPESSLYGQTILEAVQGIVGDIQNLDSLTLKTLYEHYGIELLNGISGVDFTTKEFYNTDVKTLLDDLSIVINSFTLNDISGIVGVDFSEYGLPVLDENLDSNLSTALDSIMGSLNGDLSIRKIKTSFGIDLGVEDNALLATIQDVSLSSFGQVINAITLDTLLNVDSNAFIPQGKNQLYAKVDRYEEVSKTDLIKKGDYAAKIGVETYFAGAIDTDEDGTTDTMVENELRYVAKDVDGTTTYVVDNSCYQEDFDAENTDKTFYRHIQYEIPTSITAITSANLDELAIVTYYNRIATISGTSFTLMSKGFTPLSELYWDSIPSTSGSMLNITEMKYRLEDDSVETSPLYYMMDEDDAFGKDSMLRTLDEGESGKGKAYLCVHKGSDASILQIVAPMTVCELQNAGDLLDSLTIGDVVDTDADGTALVLKSLKNSKITEIGTAINGLTIGQIIEADDSQIIKALEAHGCTLENIGSVIDSLSIGEVMEIDYDTYVLASDGAYVAEYVYVLYNKHVHTELNELNTYYTKDGDVYTKCFGDIDEAAGSNPDNTYVKIAKYRLYNAETDEGKTRWNITQGETTLAIQRMARRGYTLQQIGTSVNDMYLDELVRIASTDNIILQSMSRHGAKLDNMSTIIDELKIDEVIEINEGSAHIMKSLKEKGCKISELGTIIDTLTLAETTEINGNTYEEDDNGKYVYVSLGKDKGYYTLYNPAAHSTAQRHSIETEGTSSRVLQRLAHCTIGNLSDAFNELLLGEVMDIDIDILVEDNAATEGCYYYDSTNRLYMRCKDGETYEHKYVVSKEGTSHSVLKRLAYARVNELSSAMELIVNDMLLSELVDIYEYTSIEQIENDYDADKPADSEIGGDDSTDMFIVKPLGEDANGKYTFVYDASGKYIKRDYRYTLLEGDALNSYKTETGDKIYYRYEQITSLAEYTLLATTQNIYYMSGSSLVEDDSFTYNIALCSYLATKGGTGDFSKLYKRVAITEGDKTNTVNHEIYNNADGKLYVLLNGTYQQYSATNPVHQGLAIYLQETSSDGFYVPISTPDDGSKLLNPSDSSKWYCYHEGETTYSKRYCENIYIKTAATEDVYVYVGGKYVEYDSTKHSSDLPRYTAFMGYFASRNECYLGTAVSSDPLEHIKYRVTADGIEHQKSEAVLRFIARKQVTIDGINDVIQEATIADIMDIAPGSIFEDFADKQISELGTAIQDALSDWDIGKLVDMANITSLDPQVRSCIETLKLNDFFRSLEIGNGGIVVNLEKALGLSA